MIGAVFNGDILAENAATAIDTDFGFLLFGGACRRQANFWARSFWARAIKTASAESKKASFKIYFYAKKAILNLEKARTSFGEGFGGIFTAIAFSASARGVLCRIFAAGRWAFISDLHIFAFRIGPL